MLILASSALSVVYLWKMIEALWFHEGPKNLLIKENSLVYIPLLIITFLNIYFGLDASLVVNSSFEASEQLLGVRK